MSEIDKISRFNFFACVGLTALCLLVSAGLFLWESDLNPAITSDRPTAEEIKLAVDALDREKLADFFNFVLNGHKEISQSLAGMISAGMQFTYWVFLALAVLFAGFALSFRKILKLLREQPQ